MDTPAAPPPAPVHDADPLLAGAPNFRSVPPLPAAGGRRLRARRLFRSDALHRLTETDLQRLAALRIGTVLDLRRDDERAAAPSRWPSDAVPETRVFDGLPDALQAVRAGGWRVQLEDPGFDAEQARRWLADTYARMPVALAPAVRDAIGRLAAGDAPVLVHCTAGKDRTGFVCAMVLRALEVPHDAILEDYLESARRRPPQALARVLIEMSGIPASPRALGAIETIAGVRPEFLDAALAAVDREFGSVADYLRDCGMDAGVREALHARLLD
jgi:protein-tyrosine phosphatase